MEKIRFTFDETGEDVVFCVLGSTQMNEMAYILVVEEDEIEEDDMTAYILKAVEADDVDVYYDLVDDDDELHAVLPLLEKYLDEYDII